MGDIPTVTVKDTKGGLTVINEHEYDKSKHGEKATDAEIKAAADAVAADPSRNASGTFSEPTPTDIRYPNKDHTEFENNHGAFIGKSASEMRNEVGMTDAPGGLDPARFNAVKAAEDVAMEAAKASRKPALSPAQARTAMMAKADADNTDKPATPAKTGLSAMSDKPYGGKSI